MIGQLQSKETRTVYEEKVMRLTIDVPFSQLTDKELEQEDMLRWLDSRVGGSVGFSIAALDSNQQERL